MTVILVGNDSSDRAASVSLVNTYLETQYPCDGSGELTDIHFRITVQATVTIGTYELVSAGVYRCRDTVVLVNCPAGLNTHSGLHLACKAGDFLGITADAGNADAGGTGTGQGVNISGHATGEGTYYPEGTANTYALTLGGSGTTYTPPAGEQDILDELDTSFATYHPVVHQWLRDNYDWEPGALILGEAVRIMLEGGGGSGTAPTLSQIQGMIENLLSDVEGTFQTAISGIIAAYTDQHAALEAKIDDIQFDLADPLGKLAVAEGNIETAITAAKLVLLGTPATTIQEVKAAVDALDVPADIATATNVSDAVGTLTGEIGEAVTDVNAHTDSALALLDFAQAADITAAHSTTNGLITALNNLSEVAVQALVNAAVGTVTGELDEAVGIISGLINAIEPGGDVRYPGYDLTTRGTTVRVTSQGTVSAATHGVGGKMEGVLLSMVDVPERCTERVVQGRSNYRYPGWIVFADSQGNCDEPQWCNMDQRVYAPKLMAEPALCICGFADGVVADVTPWVVT